MRSAGATGCGRHCMPIRTVAKYFQWILSPAVRGSWSIEESALGQSCLRHLDSLCFLRVSITYFVDGSHRIALYDSRWLNGIVYIWANVWCVIHLLWGSIRERILSKLILLGRWFDLVFTYGKWSLFVDSDAIVAGLAADWGHDQIWLHQARLLALLKNILLPHGWAVRLSWFIFIILWCFH